MYFAFFILLSVFLHGKQTDGLYICLASYVISVRRTKSLLTASFRFYLTIDTLAVQLYTSLSPRRVRDFHPLERAHGAQTKISPAIAWLTIQKFIIFYCPLDGEHTIIIVVYFFIPMQQTCKMSDVFLQVLFHSSVYLIFRLLLKNRIMIILMANSNHTCLLVLRRTPVSGINCVFSFVIFNSITSPRAASIRCFMTAVFPFDVACTGFEYLSFSSFLEIETAYFDVSLSLIHI